MAKIKLPPAFAARVRSVHHPPPPPAAKQAAAPTSDSSTPSSSSPAKAPNPGVAIAVTRGRKWNSRVQKYFLFPKHIHVSDPTASVRAGDTINVAWWPSLSKSRRVTHTVTDIVKAWGDDATQRNAVWTEEQRRTWRRESLLKDGTLPTQAGLKDSTLEIGEGGEIVDVVKKAKDEARKARDGL